MLLNPSVAVADLPPSTAGHTFSDNWRCHLPMPAQRHYVLADAQRPRLEVYSRPDAQAPQWVHQALAGLGATALVGALAVDLPLRAVYRRVKFPPPSLPPLV